MAVDLSTAGSATVALAGAAALALVNSWITARAGIDGELRTKRLTVYPPLWMATSAVSRWPRAKLSRAGLKQLHDDLRSWYFETGGLFLSARARARYGDVQELIEALLLRASEPAYLLVEDRYTDLMHTVSSLRTALTEDLDTRRRMSLLERTRRLVQHRRAKRATAARISRAGGAEAAFQPEASGETLNAVKGQAT